MEEATRNGRMEISDGDGDKKGEGEGGERCSSSSSGESMNKSGSDERPVDDCSILTGGDEEKKKWVYVVLSKYPGPCLRLLKINPHDATGFQDITPKNQPKDFMKGLCDYGVAALEQKLYFVGGFYYGPPKRCSNKVWVFNTRTRKWDKSIPPMRLHRAVPRVCICDKKIYVFGYDRMLMVEQMLFTGQKKYIPHYHWAEVYDPAENKWNYLKSANKPPKGVLHDDCTAVDVCHEQKCILFYVHGEHLYGYKVDKGLWFQVKNNPFTRFDLAWGDAITLWEGLLFWHHEGTIFADRLPQDFPSSQLITLPKAPHLCGKVTCSEFCHHFWRSFLVNAGNGVLGLLCQSMQLSFYIFELRHSPPGDAPSLHNRQYRRTHPAKNSTVVAVLVM